MKFNFAKYCKQTMTVYTSGETVGAAGGITISTTVKTTFPVCLQFLAGNKPEVAGTVMMECDNKAYAAKDHTSDVKVGDVVGVGTRRFSVMWRGYNANDAVGAYFVMLLKEIHDEH